jgi:hypothetical protein
MMNAECPRTRGSGGTGGGANRSVGGLDRRQRRASFFRPSPTANLVGVEEGHRVWGSDVCCRKVPFPFFVGVLRGPIDGEGSRGLLMAAGRRQGRCGARRSGALTRTGKSLEWTLVIDSSALQQLW